MKIGIIGAGNMGGAIAKALPLGTKVKAADLKVADANPKALDAVKAAYPDIEVTTDNTAVVKGADLVIVAVKPWLVEVVAREIAPLMDVKKQVLLSIAAGVDFERLKELFSPEGTIFRMIPNTAIEVRESLSAIASYNATPAQETEILDLFGELGKAVLVPENQINALMALSSCGIAYAFRYIRAATEGGVEMGIYPKVAQEVVMQTLKGAVALLEVHGTHPEVEVDKVTTPGGTTIRGLNAMEQYGFTTAVIEGLKASGKK